MLFWNLFGIVYELTALAIILAIVLDKRDPVKSLSWILTLVLIPGFGILLYAYFGKNWRRRKKIHRKLDSNSRLYHMLHQVQGERLKLLQSDHRIKVAQQYKNLMLLLFNSMEIPLTDRNKVEFFHHGTPAFERMFQDMEQATDHIHLEFYIIDEDHLGRRLAQLLLKKLAQGVRVRIIYDGFGSFGLPKQYKRTLKEAGAELFPFFEVRLPVIRQRANNRNHRKITVIDGKKAYMGGLNIADRYVGLGKHSDAYWRDSHLRVEGDAVYQLQRIFCEDWYFVSGKNVLLEEHTFFEHQVEHRLMMQIVPTGPDTNWSTCMQAYFLAIASAEKSIFMTTPYFAPNESILTALKTAALSGVDVRLIFPEISDSWVIHWCNRSYFSELMEAGVRIFLYTKGFIHAKTLVIDQELALVGSANMDMRSFEQNFEVIAVIYDELSATDLSKAFGEDLAHSVELDDLEWRKRSWRSNAKESFCRLFAPLL